MRQRIPRGFTLVELVVTILLVAILSATVAPRFFASDGFDASLTRDALLSQIRAQQQALMAGQSCQLQVSASQFQLAGDCGSDPYLLENIRVSLNNNNAFNLDFNADGVPLNNCNNGCAIEVTGGDQSLILSIEPQGYAHGD